MRAMQSPWGIAAIAIEAALAVLFVGSAIAVLIALTVFLVRRSRVVGPPIAR